jgi:hypothetical protein
LTFAVGSSSGQVLLYDLRRSRLEIERKKRKKKKKKEKKGKKRKKEKQINY